MIPNLIEPEFVYLPSDLLECQVDVSVNMEHFLNESENVLRNGLVSIDQSFKEMSFDGLLEEFILYMVCLIGFL